MHISLTFGNKFQSCFCYIERWINALPWSEILKFLAWVVFKLLSKNHGGLQKPCRWGVNVLKKVEEHRVKILHSKRFLWSDSLLFGILSGDFQLTKLFSRYSFAPQTACQWLELFFLISKQILRARVFSEQVGVFKIRFVSYVEMY